MNIYQAFGIGESAEFNGNGNFFRLLAADNPLTVRFYRNGHEVSLAEDVTEGYAERFEVQGSGFDRVRITNGATAQTIKAVVREGTRVHFDRPPTGNVTVEGQVGITGTVDVVDGGKARTKAGDVFGWRSFMPAGAAGTINFAMIWNPPASGKRLIVKSFVASQAASVSISSGTVGWTAGAIAGGANALSNKLSGGRATAMQLYHRNNAASPAGLTLLEAAPVNVQIVEAEPIVIEPGYGFVMANDSAAISHVFSAHVVEEATA